MYALIVIGVTAILFMALTFLFHIVSGAIVGVIFLALSIRIVVPKTVKSVEFLGKFNRIMRPGINFLIPILEWTRNQQLYMQNLEVKVDGVSEDNVTVYIGLNVIYYVEDDGDNSEGGLIYRSIYNIDNPITMMRATIDEQLRAMMTKFDHKEIFTKRNEIGNEIEEKLREKLNSFGYRIDSIQVKNIDLKQEVMDAMNKVAEAQRQKEAATNQGEAEKIKMVKNAEADKESKVLIGEGIAGQREAIAEGFKKAMEEIKTADETLNGENILKFLIDSSRIETLGNIGEYGNSKLIYLNENLEGRSFSKDGKLISGSEIVDEGADKENSNTKTPKETKKPKDVSFEKEESSVAKGMTPEIDSYKDVVNPEDPKSTNNPDS